MESIYLPEVFYPLKHDANRLILAETVLFIIEFICLSPALAAGAIIYFYDETNMYLLALGLVILGCILTMLSETAFGLTYFVLIDNEEFGVFKSLKHTLSIIKNHMGRFLYLQLSFFGVYLLAIITIGIAALWIQPYVIQTTTLFYLDVTGELDEILEKKKETEPTPEPIAIDSYV